VPTVAASPLSILFFCLTVILAARTFVTSRSTFPMRKELRVVRMPLLNGWVVWTEWPTWRGWCATQRWPTEILRQLRRVLHVNLLGPLYVCRSAFGFLRESEGSAVVNVSSLAATIAYAGGGLYRNSKG
jgi:NAD(P)-dependent dehydrogenase (short-subunit alcohol dehydrogenase family)